MIIQSEPTPVSPTETRAKVFQLPWVSCNHLTCILIFHFIPPIKPRKKSRRNSFTSKESMELLSGIPLLIQQFRALFVKNYLLSWRHKRATLLFLLSPIFFMFLLFCIQKAIDARFSYTTAFDNVFDPETLSSFPIPPCENNKFFTKLPCFDFLWSGNDSQRITNIVQKIMDNNPGRPIPSHKVCY